MEKGLNTFNVRSVNDVFDGMLPLKIHVPTFFYLSCASCHLALGSVTKNYKTVSVIRFFSALRSVAPATTRVSKSLFRGPEG